jgi:hypothetical protein
LLNTIYDLNILAVKAKRVNKNIMRYLFDNYIYKHVKRETFEILSRGNNHIVQIADHGIDHIKVRIKTEGVNEKIGG